MVTTLERPAVGAALKTLQRHYADRSLAAREAAAAGRKVVGRIGNTAPVELILAAGFTPVLIPADMNRATPTADFYIDPIVPPETRAMFEAAVSGDLEYLELLVLTRPYDKLYYYLKEIYRLGRAPKLPPIYMIDLMQSQREAVRAYNWLGVQQMAKRLERAAGREIAESDLWAAIAVTNKSRALQRAVLAARADGRVSGVEAMQVLGAGYFMGPADYAETLGAYVAELADRKPAATGPKLLVVTSEPLQHLALHETLEAAGASVVAEDDWWGSRAPGDDIGFAGSAMEAILRKYWMDTPTQNVNPPEAREAWFERESRRSDIDGVVFYIPPSDIQLGWDYPRLEKSLTARGMPSLLLRQDVTSAEGRKTIAAKAAEFTGGLRAGR